MITMHTVKLFVDSIVEGPGEGLRGQVMLKVNVMAGSQQDAKGIVEDAISRLLQAEVDGEVQRTGSSDT